MLKKSLTLRAQATVGGWLLIVSLLLLGGGGTFAVSQVSGAFEDVANISRSSHNDLMPLVRATANIRFHIVQTQQWLTDISATRGQDGLDDGPKLAAEHVKAFGSELEIAKKHAAALGLTEVVTHLDTVEKAFPSYYQQGQEMADAYIKQGTSAGNQRMAAFDAEAQKLTEAVENLETAVDNRVTAETDEAGHHVADVASTLSLSYTLIIGFMVLNLVLVTLIIRRIFTVLGGIKRTSGILLQASHGQLNQRILHIWRQDELGEIQKAVNRLLDYTEAYVGEATASLQRVSRGEYFRTITEEGMHGSFLTSARTINAAVDAMDNKVRDFKGITQRFEQTVRKTVSQVSVSVDDLQHVSGDMREAAGYNTTLSNAASTAMEAASADVQAVAGASTQLAASILEISRQVSRASEAADKAESDISSAATEVAALTEAAQRIGDVVQLITDIASQTNLLALNATIEAARAGDAGKGFAVVASEVKSLAQQTARATEQIASQVGGIQVATQAAVDAISGIGGVISSINEVVASVAAAVEEQEAATREINQRVERVAVETQDVSDNVSGVRSASERTGQAADTVTDAAGTMASAADELRHTVDNFLTAVHKVV